MIMRNLDYTPAAEDLPAVVSVYVDDFFNHGLTDDDSDRLRCAIESIGSKAERFPRPVDIIRSLPKREKPLMLESNVSKLEVKQNLKLLRQAVEDTNVIVPKEVNE